MKEAGGMRPTSAWIAVLLLLASFITYWLTLAPDVLPGDSGEFQFAAPLLSVVHPTGYPLYLLLAKLATAIPIGSVAYRVNLFSALCAAASTGVLFLALSALVRDERFGCQPAARSRLENRHLAAGIATLTLAFSPTFWAQATRAEVYALNSLFVAGLLAQCGLLLRRHGSPELWQWLALLLGLALAHHRSILLLLPVLLIYLFPFVGLRHAIVRAGIALLLPLLLYLYIPLRAGATPYLEFRLDEGHAITVLARSPESYAAHILGSDFGGALAWTSQSASRLQSLSARLAGEFSVAGLGLVMIGLYGAVRAREWRLLAAFGVTALAYGLFGAAYQIGDIQDFYTPVYMIATLLVARAVMLLADWRPWLGGLALAVPIVLLATNLEPARERYRELLRAQWQYKLSSDPPRGAVLISNDRDEMMPMYYFQYVEAVRSDLVGLFPRITPGVQFANVAAVTSYALETARPVYFVKAMDALRIKFRIEQQGALYRVIGQQDTVPAYVHERDVPAFRFVGWSWRAGARTLEVDLFWEGKSMSRPDIKTFVHLIDRSSKRIAQSDHIPGGDFYPSSLWREAERIRDNHVLALPDGQSAGEYSLTAGAYLPADGPVDGLGRIDLGAIILGE